MKKYYVYLTTNIINQEKAYIGMTKYPISSEYIGSGTILRHAIKKYDKENFKRYNLGVFTTKEEAHFIEALYVKSYKTEKKYGGYNIHPRGGMMPNEMKPETKEKISKSQKGHIGYYKNKHLSEEHRLKIGLANKGKKNPMKEETKIKLSQARMGEDNPFYGRKHTKETIERMKKSRTGKKHSKESCEKRSRSLLEYFKNKRNNEAL